MCGIAGAIWNEPRRALSGSDLDRMTAALAHRGPDGSGTLRSDFRERPPYEPVPGIALGHRRLAIIDLATGGQPLANETGTLQLVHNGEIYNYRALRHRLEGSGHTFRTQGDSETIVHLYEDAGLECFQHLNGMFALALYDAERGRLVLARDRLGKKPLYFREEAGRLLFASELKAILAVPGVPRELDPAALDEYLTYQYVPHPNTIFRGIRQLPPGHYATWQAGRLEIQPYWRPDFNAEVARPEAEYVSELRALWESSIRLRLESDVPLGAFLSGGIDSSLVAAAVARQGRPLKTFTIGFDLPEFDEAPQAREVAAALGTEHFEFRVTPNAAELLPQLVRQFDEPFADSSALPTWWLAQRAREHVKVVLTGDGGDELFAGYDRYRAVAWAAACDRVPLARSLLSSRVWQAIPAGTRQRSLVRKAQRFAQAVSLPPARRYLEWVAIFNEARRASLYSDEFLARLPDSDPAGFVGLAWGRSLKRDPVTQATFTDLATYLPADLLVKVDRASMAHGLECRQPWLDHRLVELAIAMPLRFKYCRGQGKRILRQAFGEWLAPPVWRRRKRGFGIPLAAWLRHELRPLVHEVLLDGTARARGLFRPAAVEQLLAEHASERFDHGPRLWALLVLELWQRAWIDGAG